MTENIDNWTGQELNGGQYWIVSLLHHGTMTDLYLAHDRQSGEQVVVKTLASSTRMNDLSELATRFVVETEVWRKLAHPSLIRILQTGERSNRPYIVMPYHPGGSLAMRRGNTGGRAVANLRTWLPSIAAALHHMHKQRLIHCNVKPSNVLFDEQGQALLADSGMTKVLWEDGKTTPNQILAGRWPGTPRYAAPEQLQFQALDFRTEVFSLAVTVYEEITGSCPFPGESPTEVHQAQQWQGCRPAHELNSALPMQAAIVLQRALELDPQKRFFSCHSFATELVAALAAPVLAGALTAVSKGTTSEEFEDFGIEVNEADLAPSHAAPPLTPVKAPLPTFAQPVKVVHPNFPTLPQPTFFPVVPTQAPPQSSSFLRSSAKFLLRASFLALLLVLAALAGSIFFPGRTLHTTLMKHLSESPIAKWLHLPPNPNPDQKNPNPDQRSSLEDSNEANRLAKAREEDSKEQTGRLQDTQAKLKSAESGVQEARAELQKVTEQFAEAEANFTQEKSRRLTVEKERDRALQKAVKAEGLVRSDDSAIRKSLEQAKSEVGQLSDELETIKNKAERLTDKLKTAEQAAKETILWFVVSNPKKNKAALSYETRVRYWNGAWSSWKTQRLEIGARTKLKSTPGTIAVQIRYHPKLGDDNGPYKDAFINAQVFPATDNPEFKHIQPLYEFWFNDGGDEMELMIIDRP